LLGSAKAFAARLRWENGAFLIANSPDLMRKNQVDLQRSIYSKKKVGAFFRQCILNWKSTVFKRAKVFLAGVSIALSAV